MKFRVTFEINPSGLFGVPQGGMTVLPARLEYTGDSYHIDTLIQIGYGSLSEYRPEEDSIDLHLTLGSSKVYLKDNFAVVEIEASSHHEAYETATKEIGRLLQHLTLTQGMLFTFEPKFIESDDGKVFPVPKSVIIANVTKYDIGQLSQNVKEAQKYQGLSDQRLGRALEYFEHSLLLLQNRSQIDDVLSRHRTQLIASVFLNFWKAVSTIVGEPGDSDYQSRYKKFGFSYEFFMAKIEKIRKQRDKYDVAHYSLTDEDVKKTEKNVGEALQIAAEVLQVYREYLLAQSGDSKTYDPRLG